MISRKIFCKSGPRLRISSFHPYRSFSSTTHYWHFYPITSFTGFFTFSRIFAPSDLFRFILFYFSQQTASYARVKALAHLTQNEINVNKCFSIYFALCICADGLTQSDVCSILVAGALSKRVVHSDV